MGCLASSQNSLVEELRRELAASERKKEETLEELRKAKALIQSLSFQHKKTLKQLRALEEQVEDAHMVQQKNSKLDSLSTRNTADSFNKQRNSLPPLFNRTSSSPLRI